MSDRRFNPQKKQLLDNPERRKALPPEQLLKKLDIKKGDCILDLGAGTGYFAIPVSSMTHNKVIALDVEPEMLNSLKEKLDENEIQNVELIQGAIEDIPVDDASVDHVIASFVLHEVDPLSAGLSEIKRVLKNGGTCFCLEWEKKPTEQGPPLHHRIHSNDLKLAMIENGFEIVELTFPTESHYILIVRKQVF